MNRYISLLYTLLFSLALFVGPRASAFDLSTYAENSVLSEGTWVKIAVNETGMYALTSSELRSMGFSDPAKVRVYGYGGPRIPDRLTAGNFIDDLPMVQSVMTSSNTLVFYARGPQGWISAPEIDGVAYQERVINPYTETTFYFLSDREAPAREIETEGSVPAPSDEIATTFLDRLNYEVDMNTIHQTGHNLYGEDFRFTPSRTFNFTFTDRVEGTKVWTTVRMAATSTAVSRVSLTANGKALPYEASTDKINRTGAKYVYADTCRVAKAFDLEGNRLALGISIQSSGTLSAAYLDRIDVNYVRALKMPSAGILAFSSPSPSLRLSGADADATVWDVTDPLNISRMGATPSDGALQWKNDYFGCREYVAWRPGASFLKPTVVGSVARQNIHAEEVPDMVIISVNALLGQAERIANLHRNSPDSLSVLVLPAEKVFNEFGSGVADPGAFRRMLKMFYDRGAASDSTRSLRYCMLLGRPTFDHRLKTSSYQHTTVEFLPVWQTDVATNDNSSYSSDDILAMLDDGSGRLMANDLLRIALGRLPVSTEAEAKIFVDKLEKYMTDPNRGDWANQILLLADDQDNGVHLSQTETMLDAMAKTPGGDQVFINKVYIDAYPKSNGTVQIARDIMYRKLREGVLWWNFVGHASQTSWTGEKILGPADLSSLYTKNPPILYAATCDFGRWDNTETCGTETLLLTEGGGIVGAVATTRPVYIASNGNLSQSLGQSLMRRRPDGRPYTLGEIVMNTKNYAFAGSSHRLSDSNRLRYVVIGDPAMPLGLPTNRVVIDSIGGVAMGSEEQIIIGAKQQATISGHVVDHLGNPLDDFDGDIQYSIYDAEYTTTTEGRGTDEDPGRVINFEQQGSLLASGRGRVAGGRFSTTVPMPSDISQNFRNAALNVLAFAYDGRRASGINRDFYVFGYDETAPADTVAPVIDYAYLNHSSFSPGDAVNEEPMLIASVSDNIGLNLSTAGVGHQMTVRIDGSSSANDVVQYFTPAEDGSPSGTIAYPVSYLTPGAHTLTLRVFDTANNPAEASIEFFVEKDLAPTIFDVYTTTNPASVEARFIVEHNRPDASMTVTIEVFNLLGRPVWSSTSTGRSDMFRSAPVVWDLNDAGGHRVPRGIYLYRATVTTDGVTETSVAKRLAVTGH